MDSILVDTGATSDFSNNVAILLIDSSNSVISEFRNDLTVFDKMLEIIDKNIPETTYKVIFWNSNNFKTIPINNNFVNGIYQIPFDVKKKDLKSLFYIVKKSLTRECLTMPHLGFSALNNSDWPSVLSKKYDNVNVYLITDGQIGYSQIYTNDLDNLKNQFKNEISKMMSNYNNLYLSIFAVEARHTDCTQLETVNTVAGCDIYNIIRDANMTNVISKFVSCNFTYPDGFIHMQKIIVPNGYCQYGNKMFSELKTSEFLYYIQKEVSKYMAEDNQDKLLQIVQSLVTTITTLTKNKNPIIAQGIINTFSNLFGDNQILRHVLVDAIQEELSHKTQLFANYKSNLKNLFVEVDKMLNKNVADAIGLGTGNTWITLPYNNTIIMGDCSITENCIINCTNFIKCGFVVNKNTIPVMSSNSGSVLQNQCIRQWTRLVVSSKFSFNKTDDIIVYLLLGMILRVQDTSVEVHYRQLVNIMLGKKRVSNITDSTELDVLETGTLPLSNRSTKSQHQFTAMLIKIGKLINLGNFQSMTIWYILCLLTQNEKIINNQLIHCKSDLQKDFPDIDPSTILQHINVPKYKVIQVPKSASYEYFCLITNEDTSETGGILFDEHTTSFGSKCSPISVFSNVGYNEMVKRDQLICPICYTRLTNENIIPVGPKSTFTMDSISDCKSVDCNSGDCKNGDCNSGDCKSSDCNSVDCKSSNYKSIDPQLDSVVHIPDIFDENKENKEKTLVILKGTVGCGKSTFAQKLLERLTEDNHVAIVEGMDKYRIKGYEPKQAIEMIKTNFLLMQNNPDNIDKNKFVIIDTCGERKVNAKNPNVFGINFRGYKIVEIDVNLNRSMMSEYLAFSLRNVLIRPPSNQGSTYYLNPTDSGLGTCIQVHQTKAQSLFGKNINKHLPNIIGFTQISTILEIIDTNADKYVAYLNENQSEMFEKEYNKIVSV